jgi:hypothetical protein
VAAPARAVPPAGSSWLEDLAGRPVLAVGAALGLEQIDSRHLAPCPACNERKRSRNDSRLGPVFIAHGGSGWKCGACGAGGGAVRLAELVAYGSALPSGDPRWAGLRALCAERGLCAPVDPAAAPIAPPPPRPVPPPAPVLVPPPAARLDPADLAAVWADCLPAMSCAVVAGWLRSRGLDPDLVSERDLCRALPPGFVAPWAVVRGRPWSAGWRCVFPTFGPSGALVGLRARWALLSPPPDSLPKALAPALGSGAASGMVHADPVGRALLGGSLAPVRGRPLRSIIAEGEPDYLTWATRFSDSGPPIAVFGIWSGAWTDEFADAFPGGSHVLLPDHHDEAGDRYALQIARPIVASLSSCVVLRG